MNSSAIRRALAAAGLLLLAGPLRADTIKVPSDGVETIQAGIDLAVEGDVVQVAKGVYNENVVITTAGITLKGKSATINGGYVGNCITITADNVVVDNMTLVNGGGAAPPPPPDGDGNGGISATGTGITLNKLTVRSCSNFGISLVGAGNITSCKVEACDGTGIFVETNAPNGTATLISKNNVSGCTDGVIAIDGPFTVDKNTVEKNSERGIVVVLTAAEGAAPSGTTVTKNKANNNSTTGISVEQPVTIEPLVLVEKNTMDGNGEGCVLSGFSIDAKSNTIQNNLGDGLVVDASNSNIEKNKLKGNIAEGLSIFGSENTVTSNTVQDHDADGIVVAGDANILDSNTVKDAAGDGIEIAEGADDNELAGNKISGCEHDGIDNSGLNTLIVDNNSKTNGGADIAGAGDGAGTVVPAPESAGNVVSDESDISTFTTTGELDMP
jgi:parallel beta-helix repeat protein